MKIKKLKGFNDRYIISHDGSILDSQTDKFVIPKPDVNGVPYVRLFKAGKFKRYKLSKLIREHFNELGTDLDKLTEVLDLYYNKGIINLRQISLKTGLSMREIDRFINK